MGFDYIKTKSGLCKIAQELFNFIGFVCVIAWHAKYFTISKGEAFLAASIGGFIITAILIVIFLFDFADKIPVPWNKVQLIFCVLWSIFYLVVSVLIIDLGYDALIAGGVFGIFATATYLADAYFNYFVQQ